MQTRDLYVPAGDISFWQAALRDPDDELYAPVREAIETGGPLSIDLLYGDHEGGQRTITRFYMIPREGGAARRRRGALAAALHGLAPLEPRSRRPALGAGRRRHAAQHASLAEERLDRVRRHRPREQEALREVASLALQRANLIALLDALGERLQAERLAELDQRVRQRVRLARARRDR